MHFHKIGKSCQDTLVFEKFNKKKRKIQKNIKFFSTSVQTTGHPLPNEDTLSKIYLCGFKLLPYMCNDYDFIGVDCEIKCIKIVWMLRHIFPFIILPPILSYLI